MAGRIAPEDLPTRNGAHHLARYLFAAHFAPGRRVADLCCGTGYGTNLLLNAGAIEAAGVDLSAETIEEAERRFPGPRFSVGDASKPVDIDADLRVCFEGIEHVSNPDGLLRNLRSGLPGDGLAVVSTPNGEGGHSGNPYHENEWTLAGFRRMLSGHFSVVGIYLQWWWHDPLAPGWGLRDRSKSLVPGWLEELTSRSSSGAASTGSSRTEAIQFRPVPETELRSRARRVRYGKPSMFVAVCLP